jgi:hypothetical protein
VKLSRHVVPTVAGAGGVRDWSVVPSAASGSGAPNRAASSSTRRASCTHNSTPASPGRWKRPSRCNRRRASSSAWRTSTASCCSRRRVLASPKRYTRQRRRRVCPAARCSARRSRPRMSAACLASSASARCSVRRACSCPRSPSRSACSSTSCRPVRQTCRRPSTRCSSSAGSASSPFRLAPGWWPRATASRTARWSVR